MYRFKRKDMVVWHGQVGPVQNRFDSAEGYTYVLHWRKPDGTLMIDGDITFGQIVAELNSYARFCVGDKFELGPQERIIKARWWNPRRGTVIYRVADARDPRRSVVVDQETLVKKVEAYAEAGM